MLNVSWNIVFLKVTFFNISYSWLHHLYLPYSLSLNESVFITINIFLLFAIVNILTILLVGWKIAALVDEWAVAISINGQILQHMMDSTTG